MNSRQREILQEQLNNEKQVIKELHQVFKQAIADCSLNISLLSARTDMENIQTIVYQQQYQNAIKAQLEVALAQLQSGEYATISDYLTRCYQNGYMGVMYDLTGQGIPLIIPMDQQAVVKALQIDSKISKGLYNRLGEDVSVLKKNIRAEVSRGIVNGSSWNEIGEKISLGMNSIIDMFGFNKAKNNSIRIARTEGHRIQNQSAMDAQEAAKKKGANVLKQWCAALDGNTRPAHAQADGQIREFDEYFIVGGEKMKAPGIGGSAANVCNCRCALLQRARWALDDKELDTLKERAEYFGLDKSKHFEEYKARYLKVSEQEAEGACPQNILEKNFANDRIKNIELPPEIALIRGMTKDTEKAISDAYDYIKSQYNIKINNFVIESLGKGNEKVPFQFVPLNIGGFYESKLVINNDYYFNDSLEAYTERIMRNYTSGALAAKSIDDLIAHEMAHVMTFQECETYGQFIELEEEVRSKFIKGMSLYADSTWDGSETIAEAFVRYRRGEKLPENVIDLLKTYVLREAK